MSTEKALGQALREHGYRLTPQRRSLIRIIAGSREHLTPAALYVRVRREYPAIGLVTVYRTLEVLAGLGFICEVRGEGGSRSYLARRNSGEHHHHLVCAGCGIVLDFNECDLSGLEDRLARKTGFKISGHLLELTGLCRACQEKTAPGVVLESGVNG